MQVSPGSVNKFADLLLGGGVFADMYVEDLSGFGTHVMGRSKAELVSVFRELGFNDIHGNGGVVTVQDTGEKLTISKRSYAEKRLENLNQQDRIQDFVQYYFDPEKLKRENWRDELIEKVLKQVNKFLEKDGYVVKIIGQDVKIERTDGSIVETPQIEEINIDYILSNIQKCETRIQSKDFSGAVTSARSLLESVLKHLYKEIFTQEAHNLDLPELYKQVSKELNLHPTSSKLDEGLKKITGGLHTAVVGLSEVRNEAGDAHPLKYTIEEHHAVLVVNNAKTICQFLYQSYKKQNPTTSPPTS